MLIIAKHYRLDFSVEHVRVTINHESQSPRQLVLEEMARQLGLGMRVVAAEAASSIRGVCRCWQNSPAGRLR